MSKHGGRLKRRTERTGPLLAAAAAEPLACIRKDRESAEPVIRPLLVQIEENLFDYNLNTTSLKRRCGVRDNGVPVRFTSALGKSPWAYIEQRRMETACRLLAETGLAVWQIAQLVGYSGTSAFSRAFHRWSGVRPSVYRRESEARPATIPAPSGDLAVPSSPAASETEIEKRCSVQRWPHPDEVPCRRLEVWLPAELHSRLGSAVALWNRLRGDDQPRLTARDVLITALEDWFEMVPPPHDRW
jgi:AraC-like DNA-binding protein